MAEGKGRTIRLADDAWSRVEAEAAHRGLSVNAWIGMVIADALNGEHYVLVARKPENVPERMRGTATLQTPARPPVAQPAAVPPAQLAEVRGSVERAFRPGGERRSRRRPSGGEF